MADLPQKHFVEAVAFLKMLHERDLTALRLDEAVLYLQIAQGHLRSLLQATREIREFADKVVDDNRALHHKNSQLNELATAGLAISLALERIRQAAPKVDAPTT